MFSLLRRLLLLAIFLILLAFIFRNQVLSYALKFTLEQTTGFTSNTTTVDFSRFIPPVVLGYDILVKNPDDFEEALALNISRVEIVGPDDFWQKLDRLHIARLKIEITELAIVRNSTGKLNVPVIDEGARRNVSHRRPLPLIGELELTIDKVTFYDYYGTIAPIKASPQTAHINLKGQRHHNLESLSQLERLIIREGLKRAKFPTLDDTYNALDIPLDNAAP